MVSKYLQISQRPGCVYCVSVNIHGPLVSPIYREKQA